ncbi:MAG: DUF2975 domain-containing protein [Ignavibacteria bacterium]|jgi:drug/metabolite transporter (DMT)-like permease|nr:DUF2975 domain-containing protein [Ignavibacteria bacterium]MCU7517036.1 DUF2975 domain-containing protein [Ignavibacteria bacterium]
MKRSSTIFLQIIVFLIGIGALVLMLWEPHLEGRNAHSTVFQIYFNDPFLAYAYIASISFFVALYQAFKLLGFIGQNDVFSARSLKAVRTIKHCGMSLVGFILGAEAYLFLVQRGKEDDITGGAAIGLFMILVSAAIAAAATVFERRIKSAMD